VWAEGVTIRQLRRDGSEESRLEAENCLVDRSTKSGWTEGRAHAKYRDQAELDGENVYFSAAEEYVKIFTNTVLHADGRELKSVRADYDRRAGVAMFEGDVRLHGSERGRDYDLAAAQAFAFISKNDEFKRVVALGGVCGCRACEQPHGEQGAKERADEAHPTATTMRCLVCSTHCCLPVKPTVRGRLAIRYGLSHSIASAFSALTQAALHLMNTGLRAAGLATGARSDEGGQTSSVLSGNTAVAGYSLL
jgi:hypothetical protein